MREIIFELNETKARVRGRGRSWDGYQDGPKELRTDKFEFRSNEGNLKF